MCFDFLLVLGFIYFVLVDFSKRHRLCVISRNTNYFDLMKLRLLCHFLEFYVDGDFKINKITNFASTHVLV